MLDTLAAMAHPAGDSITVDIVTDPASAPEIAGVAAATFPLACPPHARVEDIDGFIRTNLNADRFAGYIGADTSDVLIARDAGDTPGGGSRSGTLIGYALVHHAPPTDPDVAAVVTDRPVTEISKLYVEPGHHTAGRAVSPSRRLMEAAIECARARGSVLVWLGVNQENIRAQRFYAKMGFTRAGEKTFRLGGSTEHDFVLTRPVTTPRTSTPQA